MLDLNRLGAGKKLIKQVLENSESKNQPWSKAKLKKQLKTQKNAYTRETRLTKKQLVLSKPLYE